MGADQIWCTKYERYFKAVHLTPWNKVVHIYIYIKCIFMNVTEFVEWLANYCGNNWTSSCLSDISFALFFFKHLKSVSVVATWVDGTYMTGYIIFLCLACWMFLSCFVSGTSIVNPFLSIQTFWRKKKYSVLECVREWTYCGFITARQ